MRSDNLAEMQATLPWDDLRVLLAVHQAGSFARAATSLGVDPATVGRRMRALREALGAPVLEGPPRRVQLTAVGARALEAARRMEEAAQALDRARVAAVEEVSGTLRLSVTEAIATGLVVPRLGELQGRFPSLRVELVGGNEAVNLSRREADLALRLFRPEEPALTARRAGTLAFAPYVSAAYVRARGAPTPGDLGSHLLLGYEARLARGSPPLAWLDELGGAVRLRTGSALAMHAAVRAGLGIGVLPCFLGDADPTLSRVRIPPRTRELWLVVHSDVRRSRLVRAGLEFLEGILAEAAPALRGEAGGRKGR
jgi:DNA-binding transcriptional LysR family regulator